MWPFTDTPFGRGDIANRRGRTKIDYIAKPPTELGKDLFSYELDDQQRQNNWSNYVGKWVVWVGNVGKVTPKLNPSRIEFLPEEYDTGDLRPLFPGQVGVVVDFKSDEWTEYLRHLAKGERVYYRARLTGKGYGVGFNFHLLFLEEGKIVHRESVVAQLVDLLVDLAYSSYEQLQELLESARRIAYIGDYFAAKLEHSADLKSAIEVGLGLMNIRFPDKAWPEKAWLQQIFLPKMEQRKAFYESKIQESLRLVLISLHRASPAQDKRHLQKIAEKRASNRDMVTEIRDKRKFLEAAWELERKSTMASIGDLLEALIGQLHIAVELALTVKEAWEKYKKLEPYQQLIASSSNALSQISIYMERISKNVIEVIGNITMEGGGHD